MTTDERNRLQALKRELGPSNRFPGVPGPSYGFSVWIENGIWFTAPTVDPDRFGGHAYDNGGYEEGIRDCPCGCIMGAFNSSGPVDPFGPCPANPKPISQGFNLTQAQDEPWTPEMIKDLHRNQ